MILETRIGKRFAIYLPKRIVEGLNLREGDKVEITVEGGNILIKPVKPFFRKRKFVAEISAEEVEKIGEKISESL